MAYWNEIYETIRYIDDNYKKYSNVYVHTYPLADSESEILVFDTTESSKVFNNLLREKLKEIPEVKQAIEDFIYDVDSRDDWYIDLATENNWTYSDEGFECSKCGKWHFYEQYNACEYANYKVYDRWIECEDCIRKDTESKERYLEDLLDNYKNANTILEYKDFIALDFEKVNEDPYANGWYYRSDSPEKILEKAKANFPNYEFVFSIRKTYNPWETEFDLWKREKEIA